jgi:ribosome maturation factor RimP
MKNEQLTSQEEKVDPSREIARQTIEAVWRIASPVCDAEGMELVHIEFQREPSGRILRLYIDKPGGVHLEDCVTISRQIGDLLDVAYDVKGPYTLEVTSPGIHRPLGKRADFDRFKGSRVKVRTSVPLEGRSNYTGMLVGIEKEEVLVVVDGVTHRIPYENIAKARLVGEYGEKQ